MPVYIVRAVGTGRYKIGYARDVERRRREIEKGATGRRLELVLTIAGSEAAEKALHRRYAERGEGLVGEWFRLNSADLEEIESYRIVLEVEYPEEPEMPKTDWGASLRLAMRALEKDRRKAHARRIREARAAQTRLCW